MSKGKNPNSILFLTTLGVCLGLVLVGGTAPQVFAHSATTRVFEISDEIEVKDDLDNKPDSDAAVRQFASALEDLYRIASEISADHPERVEAGHFNFNLFVTVKPGGGAWHYSHSIYNTGPRSYSGRSSKPLRSLYDAFLPRSAKQHEKFRVDFELTANDVSLQTTTFQDSPELAELASKPYVAELSNRKEFETAVLKSLIYSKTEISVNNNQIIIVTRLPRGSIDPLLATNAK